jgi:hypothetical protein
LIFFLYFIQHWFICRPSDSTVSEDAGVGPRTVETLAPSSSFGEADDFGPVHFSQALLIERTEEDCTGNEIKR